MKKLFLTLIAALGIVGGAHAAGGGLVPLDKAPVDVTNQASLQNGAKLFVNYCLGCHSAAFMRYNRLKDIGLSDQEIKDNLLFTTEKWVTPWWLRLIPSRQQPGLVPTHLI